MRQLKMSQINYYIYLLL